MKFRLLFLLLLTLANPVFAEAQENYGPRNAVVLIIRHAEQPDQGSGLSAIGIARADAYANYFKNFKIDGQPLKLDYLFAAGDSSNSQRPRLTIEPTGRALGLTVDSRFKNRRYLDLVDEIQSLPPGKNVLFPGITARFLICFVRSARIQEDFSLAANGQTASITG